MKLCGMVVGIAVILVTNAVALIGVSLNRRGELLETIELTEREFYMPRTQDQDNSGISLRLSWAGYRFSYPAATANAGAPFDRDKLQELGFDCPLIGQDSADLRSPLPKALFAALEYEGPAWKQWLLKETEQPSKRQQGTPFEREPNLATRLFVVDASKSAEQLRARYPDRKHYLIVRAVVRARLETTWDPVKKSNVPREWLGFVAEILPGEIHVPLPMASALSRLGPGLIKSPRFTATICYGRHLEPWISAIKLQPPAREQ